MPVEKPNELKRVEALLGIQLASDESPHPTSNILLPSEPESAANEDNLPTDNDESDNNTAAAMVASRVPCGQSTFIFCNANGVLVFNLFIHYINEWSQLVSGSRLTYC